MITKERERTRMKKKLTKGSYMVLGMSFGIIIGTSIGSLLFIRSGNIIYVTMGMMLGIPVGMCIGLAVGKYKLNHNTKSKDTSN
jgi:hypothetical protein